MSDPLLQAKHDNQFRLLDADGDGRVGRADYAEVAVRIGAAFAAEPSELAAAFTTVFDQVYGADVTIEEFRRLTAQHLAVPDDGATEIVGPLVRAVMDVCVIDDEPELSGSEFRRLFVAWGLSEALADDAFVRLDIDRSGHLSEEELLEAFEEFYRSTDPHAPGNVLFGPLASTVGPQARIPYPDPASLPAQTRQILDSLPQLNIFRMLAYAPTAFPGCLGLAKAVLAELELPGHLRELAVLQVAVELGADYVWTQHVSAARLERTPRAKIVAVRDGRLDAPCLSELEQASLAFTAEVLMRNRPSDVTFARLAKQLPPRQIVELLIAIGTYAMVSRLTTALNVDADPSQGSCVIAVSRG